MVKAIRLALLAFLVTVAVTCSAMAQVSRTTATNDNNSSYIACGNHCITAVIANTFNAVMIASTGFLADANVWLGTNTFVGSLILPGTGFAYANGSGVVTYSPPSLPTPVTTKNVNYTATINDSLILGNAASGAITITLPACSASAGLPQSIKKIDPTANALNIAAAGSDTIDGVASMAIYAPNMTVSIKCDAVADIWRIVQ